MFLWEWLSMAIAINLGHKIQVYDHNAWRADEEQVIEVIKAENGIIGIGGITTAYASIKKLVKLIKKLNQIN